MRKASLGTGFGRDAARAVLAAIVPVAIVGCGAGERRDTELAPVDTYAVTQADVSEHAHRVSVDALADLSRGATPLTAPAEPAVGATDAQLSPPVTGAPMAAAPEDVEEERSAKPVDPPAEGASKAKAAPPARSTTGERAAPPVGPDGVRAPRSAAEAAERGGSDGRPKEAPPAMPAPPRGEITPEAVSPTAPAETAPLR